MPCWAPSIRRVCLVPVLPRRLGCGALLCLLGTFSTLEAAVNLSPVNSVPGAQATDEDTPLNFSAGNGNQIQIADPDAGSGSMEMTLSVSHGTLTLAGTTGLSFTQGDGTSDEAMVFTGTMANINSALATLTYDPTPDDNGSVTLNIVTNDQGNTGTGVPLSDPDTISITVNPINDAPVASDDLASTSPGTPIDVNVRNNDRDVDNISADLTVTIVSNSPGTSATVNPDGTINFDPGATNGVQTVTYSLTDPDGLGSNIATLTLNVGPNNLPYSSDTSATFDEDTSYAFQLSDFAFTDPDGGHTLFAVSIVTLPGSGTLSLFGYAVEMGQVVATGNLSDLRFTPDANASGAPYASFTFSVQDSVGGYDPAPDTFTLNVDPIPDAPTFSGLPASRTVAEDTPSLIDINGGSFADIDSASVSVTLAMTLTSGGTASGTFSLAAGSGVLLSANVQPSFTVTGSSADVAAYLSEPTNFLYTPAANLAGNSVLTLTVSANDNDGFDGVLGTVSIDVTAMNDAPSASHLTQSKTATEGGSAVALDDIVVTDGDGGDTITATLTLSAPGAGTLSTGTYGSATSTFNAGTGVWTVTGSVADVNAALAAVALTPSANNDQNFTITTRLRDAASTGPADGTISVTVTAVNDAPSLTATGLNPTFLQSGSAVDLFSTVTAATVEAGQTFSALTLTVTNVSNGANEVLSIGGTDIALVNGNSGTLTGIGNFSVSISSGTATVSVTGMTRSNVQMGTLVDGITYRNAATPPAATARVVTLTAIQDSGGTSNSGVDSTSLSIASTVSIDLLPTVTGRTVPSNGTYKIGQHLDFTVTYSENVTVNTGGGTPYIAVTLSTGGSVNATYNAGASTATTLTFRYTIASGNHDADGISVASSITLNGGTIKDSATSNAPTTNLGFGSTAAVLVDGVVPTVSTSNRQMPSSATTNATSVVYRVTFSEAVTGVDTADFTLTTASGTAAGTIASIDPVSSTVYDVTVNTITGTGTLRLDLKNSGTGIADTPATNAIATGYTSGQTYSIDNTAPTVTSVGVPSNATYLAAQNLDFTVNWTEVVTVNTTGGTPAISLTIGSTGRTAALLSGSGTTELVFRYQTQAGDLDTDGIAVGALSLNDGTLKDPAGNDATLTLNSVGSTANVHVDAAAPTVTGRTVPSNATYKAGQHLDFTVTYSENVTVVTGGGTPYIEVTLATGGSVHAGYNGGTGTATLTFRYTIATGNLDDDGIEVASSITLNGGTIKDGVGNDAATTGLGFASTASVLVDGVAPTVSSSNRQTPSGANTNATSVVYRVTFAEAVSGVDAADYTLTKTSTANGTIASVDPVSSTVYDVTVNTITGNGTLRLDLNNAGTGIADTPATNAIATGYTAGQTYTIDNLAPTLSTIARQSPTTVNTDATSVTYRVTFDGGVTGVDAADFTLTAPTGNTPASTATGTVASVTPVSTSVYDVVVNSVAGQGKARLDLKGTGTGIADLAGNAIADGGFTTGGFYFVGATSVFDTLNLTLASALVANLASPNKVAQRFTTGAADPLTLTSVTTSIGTITGTPSPVVTINANNSGAPGSVVATLTNPSPLTANALNVWTGNVTLSPNTTYWIVFAESGTSYRVNVSTATTGGSGGWLTNPDYVLRYGSNAGFSLSGAVLLGIGATSVPAITSTLTASGSYGTAFTYQITATNSPTSYAATNLPAGLSLDTTTGIISGSPTQSGTFSNIALTATNGSGAGVPSTLVLTIAKAEVTVAADGSQSKVYGAIDPTLTYTITSGALVSGDSFTGALTRAAGEGIGSAYAIGQGTLALSTDYTLTFVGANFAITAKPITVTAMSGQSKVYGATDPAFIYTVTSGALVDGDSFAGALTRTAGENIGSAYAIGQGTLTAGANYALTFVPANFAIIGKAITVTATSGQSKVYGATDPTFIYTVTSGALVDGDSLTGALTRTAGENIGSAYAIGQGTLTAGANYALTFVPANFAITGKAITVTATSGQSKVYGANDPTFIYTVTSGALEGGDSLTGALTRAAGEDVGNTYAIGQGTLTAGGNYTLNFVSADFEITAKPITVTATSGQEKVYGASDPLLTYTITSGGPLVTGDAFTGVLARATGEDVGSTYAITQGTLTPGSNYTVTFVPDNFAITKRQLTVTADDQTRSFRAPNPTLTATITGFAFTDTTATAVTGTAALSTIADEASEPGTYPITTAAGTLSAANYHFAFVDGTITVTANHDQYFFGAIGADGHYGLYVRRNGESVLIVHLPGGGGSFVLEFALNPDGSFTAATPDVSPMTRASVNGSKSMSALTSAWTVSGSVVNGQLLAQVDTGELFNGTAQSSGSTAAHAGFYEAPTINGEGYTYLIVGPNGMIESATIIGNVTAVSPGVVLPSGEFSVLVNETTVLAGALKSDGTVSAQVTTNGVVTANIAGVSADVTQTDRLINISTRGATGDNDKLIIAGFVISGSAPKDVLIRAVGPGLTGYGVTGAMQNPVLTLFRGGQIIDTNDDWGTSANATVLATEATRLGASALAVGSKDAALRVTLDPGVYTAHITRAPGTAHGVALIEVYDASLDAGAETQKLVNISSRGEVGTGENILISGFVVTGNFPKKVLIRGVGPTLVRQGVSGVLTNPVLRIWKGNTEIASNDDWSSDNAVAIDAAAMQVGAFPLDNPSKDAAIVLTLAPGIYTAQVSGSSGNTGIALVEVYDVP